MRLVLVLLCALAGSAVADTEVFDEVVKTQFTDSELNQRFSVTRIEWEHYNELMLGMAGYWYKDIPPLEVLLIYARTDSERMNFAERVVLAEDDKLEREFAGQAAIIAAKKKLFPGKKPIDIAKLQLAVNKSVRHSPVLRLKSNSRIVALVRNSGTASNALSKLIKKQSSKNSASSLDIYFSPNFDTTSIRVWAESNSVPVNLVASNKISLNLYDASVIQSVTSAGISRSGIYHSDGSGVLGFRPYTAAR